jgi:hypothetical protein
MNNNDEVRVQKYMQNAKREIIYYQILRWMKSWEMKWDLAGNKIEKVKSDLFK